MFFLLNCQNYSLQKVFSDVNDEKYWKTCGKNENNKCEFSFDDIQMTTICNLQS